MQPLAQPNALPRLLTVAEVASLMRVSTMTVYRLIKAGDVARLVCFLASAESAPMTGSVLDYEQTVFGAHGGSLGGYPTRA